VGASSRITVADVRQAERCVNAALHAAGSPYRVRVEGRYGYLGIDEYRGDVCVRTVSTGHTRRDAYQYLLAMNAALELVAS
jgi:hypothetical protein